MPSRIILAAGLVALLAGCQTKAEKQVDRAYEVVQLDDAGRMMAYDLMQAGRDIDPKERQFILAFQVDRLSGPGWRQAHDTLVSLGKDSIPILIVALDKDKKVYREHKPRYGAQADGASVPFTLKEVAYQVLVDIVMHYSSYKGQIPDLNKAKWERWWDANGSGLTVQGTKRTISKSR